MDAQQLIGPIADKITFWVVRVFAWLLVITDIGVLITRKWK